MSLFKSVGGGFQMTFANGITVSVMFRSGNYCEHRYDAFGSDLKEIGDNGHHKSADAEIAIWQDEIWLDFGCDTVAGYLSADEVAGWIARASTAKDIQALQAEVSEAV
jgi:hypothetical protein